MENLYDLVVEFDPKTMLVTKRVELPWRYDYFYGPEGMVKTWMPPSYPEIDYHEYFNQYTPHIRLGKKITDEFGRVWGRGDYQGDLDAIKVGDAVTDEMRKASYSVSTTSERQKDYTLDSTQATMFLLTGTPFNAFRYLTSAWVYGNLSYEHLMDAHYKKGLITVEQAEKILLVNRQLKN